MTFLKIDTMIEHSLKIFRGIAMKRYKETKPPRKLFGALGKTDYIASEDDKWRHNDSQSDDEEPKLKKRMEEKFGHKDLDSSDSDYDGDDEGGDGGDAGAISASTAGASAAGTTGASSAGDDEEDTESDDNVPEPGYEFYLDERGVRQVRRIRQDDDAECVPSVTEAERLKKKQTVARRKKKARSTLGLCPCSNPFLSKSLLKKQK
ncbi:hypothetical protein HanPI659440_Chr03g0123861 [Helianthus annuus]|nr:hypothetical protein HanPI659440_Chr03g0123861 [Helianthus annuus]